MKRLPVAKEPPHFGVVALLAFDLGDRRGKETERRCEVDAPASSQVAFLHLRTIKVGYLPRAEEVELKGEKVRSDIGDDLVVGEIYLVQLTTIWAATLLPEDHETPTRA